MPIQSVETLNYTPEVEKQTAGIYDRVRDVIPEFEWPVHAPYIAAINRLKKEKNVAILAHNYQTPEIFHGIADITGDSLALAYKAAEVDADIIVMCGVHFMAETAKLLNPSKTVLIPDLSAGCSLASSITGADVRALREKYPGAPVVTYVNTSVDVKAESDICCTSSNAVKIVESMGSDRVLCIPDQYLAHYVATQTDVKIFSWAGECEVHERFTGAQLKEYRKLHPGIHVLAHPECPPDVQEEADYVGSTSGLMNYVRDNRPSQVVMITECSMSDNVSVQYPDVNFIRPCNLCPHMKRITLPKILSTLERMEHVVEIDPTKADRARLAVEKMLAAS